MVHRSKRVSRAEFKDLPNGAIYYDNLGAGPFVKTGSQTRLTIDQDPQQGPEQTTVYDTSFSEVDVTTVLNTVGNQPLFNNGNPPYPVVPGDPTFPIDGSFYELDAAGDASGNIGVTWTFPTFPLLVRGGLWLQRSVIAATNRPQKLPPLQNDFTGFVLTSVPQPVPDPNWETVTHWDQIANLTTFASAWTDPFPAGTPCVSYRLIAFTAGPTDATYLEVDWNIVSLTQTYTLTGTKIVSGGASTVTLNWGGPNGDPVSSLYEYFTIEASNSPGVWVVVDPHVTGDGSARSKSGLTPASQFRVRGYLTNGLIVEHNPVSIPPDTGIPRAQILRNFGANHGSSGSGFIPYKIAVDSVGNVIFVGLMYGTANAGAGNQAVYGGGGQDCFIAKYNPLGVCLWSRNYGNVSNDKFKSLCVDSNDNIYVIGTVSGAIGPDHLDFHFGTGLDATFGGADIIVAKFGPNAELFWHKIFGGSGSDQGEGIAVDSNGDVYLTGTTGFFGTGADFGGGALPVLGRPSSFLAKLHGSDGSYIWAKSYGNNNEGSFAVDVKISSDGHPVVGAEFQGHANWGTGAYASGGGYDAAIFKVNAATGDTFWVQKISGVSDNRMSCLATLTGKIFAVGAISTGGVQTYNGAHPVTPGDGGSFYLLQIDNSGVYANSTAFGSDISTPVVFGVAASDLGIFVTGEMSTGVDFGQGWLLGNGGPQVFLLRFNPDLTTAWSRRGHSPTLGSSGAGIIVSGGQIYCVSSGAVDGFDYVSGFNQVTAAPPITTINTPNVDNDAFWVRFSP